MFLNSLPPSDGTKIVTYPERTSTGKPGWSVTPPGGKDGDGGKGSIGE